MTCVSCAARIEKRLNRLDGVDATVNYASEKATVRFDPSRVTLEQLIAAVEAIGYGAALPRAVTDATQRDNGEGAGRGLARRLLAAILLTAPLTLVAMVPPLQFSGWEWLALALA